jgi:hypothetical protein
MAPRALGLTLALLAATAIAAGVLLLGGGRDDRPLSPDQYREELVAAFADVQLNANPTDGDAVQDYADRFRDLEDELDDLVPPADAAPAHAKLVAGLAEYADQLDSLADAGRAGAIALQQQLAETGGVPGQAWVEAFNDLAARGYLTSAS